MTAGSRRKRRGNNVASRIPPRLLCRGHGGSSLCPSGVSLHGGKWCGIRSHVARAAEMCSLLGFRLGLLACVCYIPASGRL